VRDLVRHLGKVQRWATDCLRAGPDDHVARPRGPQPDVDPLTWFAEGAAALLDTLSTVDLDAPVQSWAGTQHGSWWLRRLTHETAIHRWDAQAAAGEPDGFAPLTAADGVQEFLDEFLVFADLTMLGERSGSIHLHATDAPAGGGEWYVAFGPSGIDVVAEHRKGDVAVRGSVSDLFLLVWRRRDAADLDVVGDRGALDLWREIVVV
jgi:uncharacterized protein (TIGR03083 family)